MGMACTYIYWSLFKAHFHFREVEDWHMHLHNRTKRFRHGKHRWSQGVSRRPQGTDGYSSPVGALHETCLTVWFQFWISFFCYGRSNYSNTFYLVIKKGLGVSLVQVDLSECFNAMVQQETLEGDEMVPFCVAGYISSCVHLKSVCAGFANILTSAKWQWTSLNSIQHRAVRLRMILPYISVNIAEDDLFDLRLKR